MGRGDGGMIREAAAAIGAPHFPPKAQLLRPVEVTATRMAGKGEGEMDP